MKVSLLAFVFCWQFSKKWQFENDSCRLSNFWQTHIFWNFDQISRIYNQFNYRNIWFSKVIIILSWLHKCFFFNVFSGIDPHLNAVEIAQRSYWSSYLSICILLSWIEITVISPLETLPDLIYIHPFTYTNSIAVIHNKVVISKEWKVFMVYLQYLVFVNIFLALYLATDTENWQCK